MKLSSAFKLRNAEPPDVEFALVNGAVTKIVPKTRRWCRLSQAKPASFMRSLV
jgi:hypothetical protein